MRITLRERLRILPLFPGNQFEVPTLPIEKKTVWPRTRTPEFEVKFLQLPLLLSVEEPETAIQDDLAAEADNALEVFAYVPDLDDCSEPYQWSDEGIYALHSALLYESLAALAGRGNGEQKREILQWIFEPDAVTHVCSNGRVLRTRNWEVPWTFAFCCRLENMKDPDIIRDFIASRLPKGCADFL